MTHQWTFQPAKGIFKKEFDCDPVALGFSVLSTLRFSCSPCTYFSHTHFRDVFVARRCSFSLLFSSNANPHFPALLSLLILCFGHLGCLQYFLQYLYLYKFGINNSTYHFFLLSHCPLSINTFVKTKATKVFVAWYTCLQWPLMDIVGGHNFNTIF